MDPINNRIAVKVKAIKLVEKELTALVQVKSALSPSFQEVMDTAFEWIKEFNTQVEYVGNLQIRAGGKENLTINSKVYNVIKLAQKVEKIIDSLFGKVRNGMLHLQFGTTDNIIFQTYWKLSNPRRFSFGAPKFVIPS